MLLAPSNHRFRKDSINRDKSKTYFRCCTANCKTRYTTTENWFEVRGACKHPANAARVAVEKIIQTASEMVQGDVRITTRDAKMFITKSLQTDAERRELEKMSTLTRHLNRVSKKAVNEAMAGDFHFEDVKTSCGKEYVTIIESVPEDIIMFCSDEQLKIMKRAKLWAMDGTFQTIPKPWKQIYIIHAVVGEEEDIGCFPCCFVLMTKRTKDNYRKIFEQICSKLDGSKPAAVILDQEKAVMSTLKLVFPGVQLYICYFHLKQAFYRKIRKLDLADAYNMSPVIAEHLKCFAALAFLKPEDIPTAFEDLQTHSEELVAALKHFGKKNKVRQFEDFIEDGYIGRIAGRQVLK